VGGGGGCGFFGGGLWGGVLVKREVWFTSEESISLLEQKRGGKEGKTEEKRIGIKREEEREKKGDNLSRSHHSTNNTDAKHRLRTPAFRSSWI